MRALRPCAVLLAAMAGLAAAEDDPPPQGMDIVPLVREAVEVVAGREPPVKGRPWSDELADLTHPDPAVANPAVGRLARRGAVILPDLEVVSGDRDWQVRARIVRVAAGIGGEAAAPLVLKLSRDADARVRRIAAVALGRCRGDAVFARLSELLASLDGDERALAAPSLAALGDLRAIPLLTRLRSDPDGPAREAMARSLADLCRRAEAAGTVADQLSALAGDRRRALLEALDGISDPRLCPALTRLIDDSESLIVLLAVRSLATAGDARAVPALVRLAASERRIELREAAANTLQILTGYRAGPSAAWTLWWRENQARWERLALRDAQIAQLADLAAPLPAGLAAWTPEELSPLIDAALVLRPVPAWLPGRALAALRAQAGERWVQPLAERLDTTADAELRLDLIVLLQEIGGEAAAGELERQRGLLAEREAKALETWREKGLIPPDTGAERALLAR